MKYQAQSECWGGILLLDVVRVQGHVEEQTDEA